MSEVSQQEVIKTIVKALDSKRAENIRAVGVRDISILADYFVIASASSTTQTKALADAVEYELSKIGITPYRIESDSSLNWILLDYQDIIVHVFYKETRKFYDLENLWADGTPIDISEYVIKENGQ